MLVQLSRNWFGAGCMHYKQQNVSAIIAYNAPCTLVHALFLAAWLFGLFVTVMSNNGLSKSVIQTSIANKKTFQVGKDECIAMHIRLLHTGMPIALDVRINAQRNAKQTQCVCSRFR